MHYNKMIKNFGIVVISFLIFICSTSEKAKNNVPYKYRTPAQVDAACKAQREENRTSQARVDSNAGNFLIGVMMGLQEDWACDPYR